MGPFHVGTRSATILLARIGQNWRETVEIREVGKVLAGGVVGYDDGKFPQSWTLMIRTIDKHITHVNIPTESLNVGFVAINETRQMRPLNADNGYWWP